AYRTRKCAWQHFHVVGKRFQLLHGCEQHSRSLFRVDGKFRAAQIAYHQRVPAQQEPRVGATRLVRHEQRYVLRRVSRRVQDSDLNVSNIEDVILVHTPKRVARLRASMQHVLRTGKFRKLSRGGNVIGVNVCVDDIANLNLTLTRHTQIHLWLVDRVTHGAQALARSTEKIRNTDSRRRVQELSKNHSYLST